MPWTESGPATRKGGGGDWDYYSVAERECWDATCARYQRVESYPYQRLVERACPGPVDQPHPARLYLSTFWVQNHWGRWAHARKSIAELRWDGKGRRKPGGNGSTTVGTR